MPAGRKQIIRKQIFGLERTKRRGNGSLEKLRMRGEREVLGLDTTYYNKHK